MRQVAALKAAADGFPPSPIALENYMLLQEALADRRSGWSMGSFGAIAEFHFVEGDALPETAGELGVATPRGAIAFNTASLNMLTPVAYEGLSSNPRRWTHTIALCQERDAACRSARTVLTELGSDEDAVLTKHRGGLLFDLGLGLPQADFCIRTDDGELIDILCAHEGLSIFDPANPAIGEVLSRHPHRVVVTNIGRIEVFQKIGGPETGGVSPEGPHTHLLPKLLRSGRTHAATAPIPPGLTPCGYLHPPLPFSGSDEKDMLDEDAETAFQSNLAAFGIEGLAEAKAHLRARIEDGTPPSASAFSGGRHARMACRVLLRQLRWKFERKNDVQALARLAEWEATAGAHSTDQPEEAEQAG
ncbi:DUF6925 family protein [Aestuariivirga sp.]|uniref:DUF6925 family protein n=1 Tax=Aestuariivirga sp. TaxID=2650926 RepID=UPI0039E6AFDB